MEKLEREVHDRSPVSQRRRHQHPTPALTSRIEARGTGAAQEPRPLTSTLTKASRARTTQNPKADNRHSHRPHAARRAGDVAVAQQQVPLKPGRALRCRLHAAERRIVARPASCSNREGLLQPRAGTLEELLRLLASLLDIAQRRVTTLLELLRRLLDACCVVKERK